MKEKVENIPEFKTKHKGKKNCTMESNTIERLAGEGTYLNHCGIVPKLKGAGSQHWSEVVKALLDPHQLLGHLALQGSIARECRYLAVKTSFKANGRNLNTYILNKRRKGEKQMFGFLEEADLLKTVKKKLNSVCI